MKKLKVGLDLDDVTIEFVSELVQFTNALKRTNYSIQDINTYDMSALYSSEEEKDHIIGLFYQSELFKTLPYVTGFEEVHQRLKDEYSIYFITSRYGSAIDPTKQFFKHQGLPVNKLHFTCSKGTVCRKLGLDFFIDDAIHNVEHISSHSPKTVPVLFTRPWNKEENAFYRVSSWSEIERFIKEYR